MTRCSPKIWRSWDHHDQTERLMAWVCWACSVRADYLFEACKSMAHSERWTCSCKQAGDSELRRDTMIPWEITQQVNLRDSFVRWVEESRNNGFRYESTHFIFCECDGVLDLNATTKLLFWLTGPIETPADRLIRYGGLSVWFWLLLHNASSQFKTQKQSIWKM